MKENMYRDIYCGEVNSSYIGKNIRLAGWVNSIRNLGNLVFITLRDETGIVQLISEDVEKYTSDKVPPKNSKDSHKYDEDEGLANIFDKINDIQQKIKTNNRGSNREAAFALFEALASALGEDSDLDNSYSSSEEDSDSV